MKKNISLGQEKLTIGLIFGGKSFEHEVSKISAQSVLKALNKNKYKIILIGVTKTGEWLFGEAAESLLKGRGVRANFQFSIFNFQFNKIDVFFPMVHGPFGEDGTLQGFLEILGKPYVGAGVLASAIGMDKITQKIIFQANGLPVAPFIYFNTSEFSNCERSEQQGSERSEGSYNFNDILRRLKFLNKKNPYPCFIKPSNSGSSVGISKAHNEKELIQAIKLASRYDYKVLIEKAVPQAREIEVSVLGNEKVRVSVPGEVVPSNEFYDYKAKYIDNESKLLIPANLGPKIIKKIQELAEKAYKLVDCSGMARADFLLAVRGQNPKIYLNEINTIPGFTSISMYPKLWEASGLAYSKLLDELIKLAIQRWQKRQKLTDFVEIFKS